MATAITMSVPKQRNINDIHGIDYLCVYMHYIVEY